MTLKVTHQDHLVRPVAAGSSSSAASTSSARFESQRRPRVPPGASADDEYHQQQLELQQQLQFLRRSTRGNASGSAGSWSETSTASSSLTPSGSSNSLAAFGSSNSTSTSASASAFNYSTSSNGLHSLGGLNNNSNSTISSSSSKMGRSQSQTARSQMLGACIQVLSIVVTSLYHAVTNYQVYMESFADTQTTRQAKLLYVGLLERIQKERGEWCGFSKGGGGHSSNNNQEQETDAASGASAMTAHDAQQQAVEELVEKLADMPQEECFSVLHALLDVSFRNLRGALVDSEVYLRHKSALQRTGMESPPSLQALLVVRSLLNDMDAEEKQCLFRLISLWHAISLHQDLQRILEEHHAQVFSESSEIIFGVHNRKVTRVDPFVLGLLQILVQYRESLFSDIEFLLIKQELHLRTALSDCKRDEEPEVHEVVTQQTSHEQRNGHGHDDLTSGSNTSNPNKIPLAIPIASEHDETQYSHQEEVSGIRRRLVPSVVAVAIEQPSSVMASTPVQPAAPLPSHATSNHMNIAAPIQAVTVQQNTTQPPTAPSFNQHTTQGQQSAQPQVTTHSQQIPAQPQAPQQTSADSCNRRPPTDSQDLTRRYVSYSITALTICTVATIMFIVIRNQQQHMGRGGGFF